MPAVMQAIGALISSLWWLLLAHFKVWYLFATILALPAAWMGQGLVPYFGDYFASLTAVGIQFYTYVLVYHLVQKGSLNPLMRKLCPFGQWEGHWWELSWAQVLKAAVKRIRKPREDDETPPPAELLEPAGATA
jgi:hypothetical protein